MLAILVALFVTVEVGTSKNPNGLECLLSWPSYIRNIDIYVVPQCQDLVSIIAGFSVGVIKHWRKTGHMVLLNEVRTGSQGRNWSRYHRGTMLTGSLLWPVLGLLSFTPQSHLSRYSALDIPISLNNQGNACQTWPQASQIEEIPSEVSSSQLCW